MLIKGELIAFCGVDGSGKTTLVSRTYKELLKQGKKVKKISTFNYLFLNIGVRIWKLFAKNSETKSPVNHPLLNYKKKNYLEKLLPYLVILDNWLYYLFKIFPNLLIYDYLISDRYFYDFGPGFLEFGYGDEINISRYFRLIPRPDYCFFLDVPAGLACQRKKDHDCGYIIKLVKNYQNLFSKFNFVIKLDSRQSVNCLVDEIKEFLRT